MAEGCGDLWIHIMPDSDQHVPSFSTSPVNDVAIGTDAVLDLFQSLRMELFYVV